MKHEDERGVIEDLYVGDDYAITRITFAVGAVRGNHYHKHTVQHDWITKGRLACVSGEFTGVVEKGFLVTHEKNKPHAYRAIEESEIISLVMGPRKGEDYESDTYRLETPLL